MTFLCIYDNNAGEGSSLKEAYDDLFTVSHYEPSVEDCEFYEVDKPLTIEVKIAVKQVTTKVINKAR